MPECTCRDVRVQRRLHIPQDDFMYRNELSATNLEVCVKRYRTGIYLTNISVEVISKQDGSTFYALTDYAGIARFPNLKRGAYSVSCTERRGVPREICCDRQYIRITIDAERGVL